MSAVEHQFDISRFLLARQALWRNLQGARFFFVSCGAIQDTASDSCEERVPPIPPLDIIACLQTKLKPHSPTHCPDHVPSVLGAETREELV